MQYVKTALALARNIPKLQELRQSLRTNMLKSPLCDGMRAHCGGADACLVCAGKGFTKCLEMLYRQIWHDYCAGNTPTPSGRPVDGEHRCSDLQRVMSCVWC